MQSINPITMFLEKKKKEKKRQNIPHTTITILGENNYMVIASFPRNERPVHD